MKRGLIGATALLVSALGLSGCFEIKQDYTFRADGTAEMAMTLKVDAALIAMAEQNKTEDTPSWCGTQGLAKEGVTGTATLSTEGADAVCTLTLAGSTEDLVTMISETGLRPGDETAEAQKVSITSSGDRHEFVLVFPSMKPEDQGEDNPMAQSAQAMMLSRMSGRVMSFSVTAPQILETNGKISEDGKIATLERPMAEAYTSDEGTEFRVTFSTAEPSLADRFLDAFR